MERLKKSIGGSCERQNNFHYYPFELSKNNFFKGGAGVIYSFIGGSVVISYNGYSKLRKLIGLEEDKPLYVTRAEERANPENFFCRTLDFLRSLREDFHLSYFTKERNRRIGKDFASFYKKNIYCFISNNGNRDSQNP